MTDIVKTTVKHLLTKTSVTSLVMHNDKGYYIFQWKPYLSIAGTGGRAIVVSQRGSWVTANRHNTMRFPRLVIDIYADPTRDPSTNNASAEDAESRGLALFDAVDKILHCPGSPGLWDGVEIFNCARISDPSPIDMPLADDTVVLQATYAATLA